MDVESNRESQSESKNSDKNATGKASPAVPGGTATPTVDWFSLGPPGRNGTIMSFVAVLAGVIVSIITYVYAPNSISLDSWEDGCPSDGDFERSCKANSAVLRVSCALTVLFGLQLIGTFFFTRFYDMFWIIKFCGLIALVIGFFFGSSSSFGLDGYAWFARITGFFFLILQQIILLDVAYSWNERWLAYAGGPDGEKNGNWLVGIIVISLLLFAGAYSAIGVMFWQYGHCQDSTVIIGLTLALTVVMTLIQLFFSDEGSILTSAIMTAYATYICYSAVTLNPSAECNYALDTGYQTLSTVIGLALTAISLLWTTYNTGKIDHSQVLFCRLNHCISCSVLLRLRSEPFPHRAGQSRSSCRPFTSQYLDKTTRSSFSKCRQCGRGGCGAWIDEQTVDSSIRGVCFGVRILRHGSHQLGNRTSEYKYFESSFG